MSVYFRPALINLRKLLKLLTTTVCLEFSRKKYTPTHVCIIYGVLSDCWTWYTNMDEIYEKNGFQCNSRNLVRLAFSALGIWTSLGENKLRQVYLFKVSRDDWITFKLEKITYFNLIHSKDAVWILNVHNFNQATTECNSHVNSFKQFHENPT